MSVGLVGKKRGMTRVFKETGESVPVTVIEVTDNRVTQLKTVDHDGYNAIQVKSGVKKAARVTEPLKGIFKKAEVEPGEGLCEFRIPIEASFEVGQAISVDLFQVGQLVDVQATSKGKGFAGVIKRWNFRTQDATHGNSLSHRAHGSTGQNQTPGRVFKGKKMAGQMGNKKVTVQSQELVRVDSDRNLLLIKGG
ncbi:MAG: 50S ribosomal protein L3, partial [Gammaproteobacteria bacterium]